MVSAAEPKRRRPRGVTLLALGVLTIASLNLVRCVLAVRQWTFLSEWSGTSPLYLLLTGTVWSLVGWSVWAGLWWGKRWAPGWLIRLGVVYSIYFWLERLFLYDRSASIPVFQPVLPGNWVFLVGLNLVSLVFMFWTLRRKKTEAYFMNPSPRRP